MSVSPATYRRIALWALLSNGLIMVTGAGVRLTGSGLGCPDWPTCKQGEFVPPLYFHPMVEFGNRLVTGVVGVAVILAVVGSLARVPRRRDLTWLSLGLVAGVLAQVLLGAIVVWTKLTPITVMSHFLLSVVLMWNATVLLERAGHDGGRGTPLVSPGAVWLGRAMVAAAAAVTVAGTVVTGTGPHGGDDRAERFGFEIATVTFIHAVLAWVLVALTVALVWAMHRQGVPRHVMGRAKLLIGAIFVQGALGYTQYALGVPPLLVAFHIAGSIVVWVAVIRLHLGLFAHAPEVVNLRDPDPPLATVAR